MFLLCPESPPLSPGQAWESLEEAEYRRELALRNELIRQEKLEQLARRFDRKAAMRETWLSENQRLVAQVMGTPLGMAGKGQLSRDPSTHLGWSPSWLLPSLASQDWVGQASHLKKNSSEFNISCLGTELHNPKMAPEAVINQSQGSR